MFTCRACLRRALGAVSSYGHSRNVNTSCHNLPPFRAPVKQSRPSSRYATVATHAQFTDGANSIATPSSVDPHGDVEAAAVPRSVERVVRKELEYLRDPLHIANRVKLALDKDDFQLAGSLTREASKKYNVTVSWNHLIDYQMGAQRLGPAIKLYNEMKKRAQQPNAQTFTIIFRGCAKSDHPKQALNEAVKLYQNMLALGRIKPNTIHLNAVLQVCAKVGDLDSMFSILSTMDDQLRSPNNLTYTCIFNALRVAISKEPLPTDSPSDELPPRVVEANTTVTIKRAKAIWQEVITRWRAGSLIIDEELVCAMGRILLLGGYSDIDAIESLIEQTMMIPREENKGLQRPEEPENTALALPRPVTLAPGAPATTHALPGNNSLSMIIEALGKTRRTTKAIKYWNLFTLHHNVVPDVDNWAQLLRAYHIGKNSGRAASALQTIPSDMLAPKHIRVAMKTCVRDNINSSALDNATSILKTMKQNPSTLDITTLQTYLQAAHASKKSFARRDKLLDESQLDTWARNMFAALEHLWEPYQMVAKKYVIEPPNLSDPKELPTLQYNKGLVVGLARRIASAYDSLANVNAAALTPAQLATIKARLASLSRLIRPYFQNNTRLVGKPAGEPEEVYKNGAIYQRNVGKVENAFRHDFPKRGVPRYQGYRVD
ncbi:hypothetical protein F5Y07DRAFT_401096 [Xylaria sp. FL0933]|nr:hypothetical protein F5Y07DRAFT_401096 [Xylaria sp. FL0933]